MQRSSAVGAELIVDHDSDDGETLALLSELRSRHAVLPYSGSFNYSAINNFAVRRAVLMGVNQNDYMASVTGGDATAYKTCASMFPCGTHFGQEVGADVMRGDVDLA